MIKKPSTDVHVVTSPPDSDMLVDAAEGADANPLHLLMSLSKRGDIARHDTRFGPIYLINHPDAIHHVFHSNNYVRGSLMRISLGEGLLTSEGPYWRDQRRAMQSFFHQQSIAAFDSIITDSAIRRLARWQTYGTHAQSIDVGAEMKSLTLEIISKALFGADFADRVDQLCEAITKAVEYTGYFVQMPFTPGAHVSGSRRRQFDEALQTIDRLAYDIIEDHRRKAQSAPLLSMLLAGRDNNEKLNDRQLRDEVVTMLLAGHMTLTDMLVWTWVVLAGHPLVEDRLHAELTQVLGKRIPTAPDAPRLQYVRMVLQESMRLYPPVWFIARKPLADDEIHGCRIPADATVFISPYTMHRHPGFWEKPEQFDPERFRPEISDKRPRYAYLPFGGGAHLCIGNHLAMLEGQLVLATIAQSYRLALIPGQSIEPHALLTLRTPATLRMRLESRAESPRHA